MESNESPTHQDMCVRTGITDEEYNQAKQAIGRYLVTIPIEWVLDDDITINWDIKYETYASGRAEAHRISELFVSDMSDELATSFQRKVDDEIFNSKAEISGPLNVELVDEHKFEMDHNIGALGVSNKNV